jgi:hypothetical protein
VAGFGGEGSLFEQALRAKALGRVSWDGGAALRTL